MNNNYLPTYYYVYKHTDPRTGELLYIGHGSRGRAWVHGGKKTVSRCPEHFYHLESLVRDGFHAGDWVTIMGSGYTKSDACELEREYIKSLNPTYNKPQGKSLIKLTPGQYNLCVDMRNDGMYYHQIAKEVGVSAMTVYRALNGQTKNIGEEYGS